MDIKFKQVSYTYQLGTPFEQRALFDIDLDIHDGSYTALIGHTGSGKSTLLQHLNALVKPTSGEVWIGERQILPETDNKNLKPIRKKVGIVFQFPESQLFEETVLKDVAFGPQNFGVSQEDAFVVAKKALQQVGLDERFLERSPFDLSGGQMRRVAIAGVLAMEPEVLVLDEPTAGLDPQGRKEMMDMFFDLHQKHGLTIVLVTHLMDDVADFADYVVVLEKGTIVKKGTPQTVFSDSQWLKERQLDLPTAMHFAKKLEERGFVFDHYPLTLQTLTQYLQQQIAAPIEEAGDSQ